MKLIPISGKEMCKIVEKLGFQKVRQAGSHVRYYIPMVEKQQSSSMEMRN